MRTLNVHSKTHNYDIDIKNSIFKDAFLRIKEKFPESKFVFVIDQNVFQCYDHQIQDILYDEDIIVLDMTEKTKNMKTVEFVYSRLHKLAISRQDVLVAIGGGITTDLVGFVAATYLRGIRHINIPTTLLSMVDATIGGKVGVNYKGMKNQIGSFHAPVYVMIDPNFLKTLDKVDLRSGVSEMVKVFYLKRPDLINKLLKDEPYEHIDEYIFESLSIKKYYVEEDEFESNLRMYLNFGHTYGHAIESFYRFKKYSHGEAVWLGMGIILKDSNFYDSYLKLTEKYKLPNHIPNIKVEYLVKAMKHDKKNINGNIHIVDFNNQNQPYLHELDLESIGEKYLNAK
jgi:3-dehydroquinate synthase